MEAAVMKQQSLPFNNAAQKQNLRWKNGGPRISHFLFKVQRVNAGGRTPLQDDTLRILA